MKYYNFAFNPGQKCTKQRTITIGAESHACVEKETPSHATLFLWSVWLATWITGT